MLQPVCPFTFLPAYPFTRLPVYPFTRLPVYPFTRLPAYPFTGSNDHHVALILVRRYRQRSVQKTAIHLGPHTNLAGDVNTRFDGKADAGKDQPLFPRFQVVEIRTRSVQVFLVDRVAGAVREIFAKPAADDDLSGSIVGLPTSHRRPCNSFFAEERKRSVACIAHGLPDAHRPR